jgi:hypothetical protein
VKSWIGIVAWLGLAAPGLAAPASAGPAPEPQTRWEAALSLRGHDLDALERAARDCGATRIERHRDSTGEWLSIGLDAGERPRIMSCVLDWTDRQALPARVPDYASPEQSESLFAVAGPPASIGRMAKVVRKCGFRRVERKPIEHGQMLLLAHDLDRNAKPRDPKLTCAYQWMNAHPLEALQLVVRTPGP